MDYCGPRGIPHSEFLAWDIDDQAKALGWAAEEAQRCSQCGTAEWEWTEGGPNTYEYAVKVCAGCNQIGNGQKESEEMAKAVPGVKVYLRKPEEAGGGES